MPQAGKTAQLKEIRIMLADWVKGYVGVRGLGGEGCGIIMVPNKKVKENQIQNLSLQNLYISKNPVMAMTDQTILNKIHALPESLKQEILDFIEFIGQKYRTSKQQKQIPQYGSLKGTFEMRDDFDDPLEDFKDYM